MIDRIGGITYLASVGGNHGRNQSLRVDTHFDGNLVRTRVSGPGR